MPLSAINLSRQGEGSHSQTIRQRLSRYLTWETLAVLIFFAALLALGLILYRDYGLHWDSASQVYVGDINYSYATSGDTNLLSYKNRYYGPVFEMFLHVVTQGLPDEQKFYTRHLFIFLAFYLGVFCFYRLAKKVTGSWLLGLAGSLFLVASPRIFADSFYNSKDIPFLAAYILAALTLIRYLEKPSMLNAGLHGLISAILVDLRMPGVLIPVLTVGFILIDLLFNRSRQARRGRVLSLILYIILTTAVVVLFWPILWHDPLGEFINAFHQMGNFPWEGGVDLYRGRFVEANALPWHYIPYWMAITTPVIYSLLAGIGMAVAGLRLVLRPGNILLPEKRNTLLAAAWLFAPIGAVILFHSTLYDGWRQMFFVYPALLLLAVMGLRAVLKLKLPRLAPPFLQAVLLLAVAAGMFPALSFMIRYHPDENVYFNRLAGSDWKAIKARFEMDYWGISYKQGLDYILKTDASETIPIFVENDPGYLNSFLLPPEQRKRLVYVGQSNARYFLTNYRYHPQPYEGYTDEVFAVKVEGVSILSVFRTAGK